MAWSGNRCRVKQSIRLWRLQPFQIESLIPLQSGDFTTLPWEGCSKFPNKWVHERGYLESGLSRPGPTSRIFFITGLPQGIFFLYRRHRPLGSSEKGVPRFLTAPIDCLQNGKGLAPMMETTYYKTEVQASSPFSFETSRLAYDEFTRTATLSWAKKFIKTRRALPKPIFPGFVQVSISAPRLQLRLVYDRYRYINPNSPINQA